MSSEGERLLQSESTSISLDYDDGDLAESMQQEQPIVEGEVYFEFDVGPVTLMVVHEVHCEYLQAPNVSSLPLMPAWMHGLINVRGALVPVFNLHQILGFESDSSANKSAKVLVMDRNEEAGALLIDGPPRVVRYSVDKKVEPACMPYHLSNIVSYAISKDGKECYVIQHRDLFELLFNIQFNRRPDNG